MEIVYLLTGCIIGALILFLIMRACSVAKTTAMTSENNSLRKQLADKEHLISEQKVEHAGYVETLKSEFLHEKQSLKLERDEDIKQLKQEHLQALSELKTEYDHADAERRKEFEARLANERQAAADQRTKELADLQKSYNQQLELIKEQITTSTQQFIKEQTGELHDSNSKRMDEIFKPLKEDLERMEKSMTDHRVQNAKTTAGFEQTIKQMLESNERIGREADRLSSALQKQNKTVGNWGELILSELLESQGLREGTHFDVQQTLKDASGKSVTNEETGSRMIPDVVLHLADGRDVVVDSKMSLTAFIDYQNAETEEQRRDALKRHITSVRNHITELAGKNYSEYIQKPRKSIDFVIMFVPIEGALQLAMSADSTLWRDAFEKKIFIATGHTLIAALRIIDLTWVNILQERNTEKIMDEARKLIDRVEGFYREFQAVGKKLSEAQTAYTKVTNRVNDSSQSILATGRRLEDLGARGKKPLPEPDYDLLPSPPTHSVDD